MSRVLIEALIGAVGAVLFIGLSFFVSWPLLLIVALLVLATEVLIATGLSPYGMAASVGVYLVAVGVGVISFNWLGLATSGIP